MRRILRRRIRIVPGLALVLLCHSVVALDHQPSLALGAAPFRGQSLAIAIVCGFLAVALGLFTEWRFAPFIDDLDIELGGVARLRCLLCLLAPDTCLTRHGPGDSLLDMIATPQPDVFWMGENSPEKLRSS